MRDLGRLWRAFRGLPKRIQVAGELATALAAILALVFLVFPELRPDEGCGGVLRGELASLTLDREVTREGSLLLSGASTAGVPPERLRQPGKLVGFTLFADGLRGERLAVRTWVLGEGGEPVPDPELRNQLAVELTPEACSDSGRERLWSPLPRRPGTYMIQVDLLRPSGALLDSERTETFSL